MKGFVSILSATLVGSLLLQGYFAIWHPSSFGRLAELPVILIYAAGIVTVAFLVFVLPSFFWMRRNHRHVSPGLGFLGGVMLGFLVMLFSLALFGWPMRWGELVAGSLSGGVGISVYARLVFAKK